MDEELKALFGLDAEDEAQAEVVDQPETEDVTDEGAESEEELSAEDTAGEPAIHQQTREENQAYAAARREAEARERQAAAERDEAKGQIDILMRALAEYGYEGTPQEIADNIMASRQGTTAEAVRQQREQQQKAMDEAIRNHPLIKEAEEQKRQSVAMQTNAMIQAEIRNIQKINPEIKGLQDLRNLGDKQEMFDALIRGGMHLDKAYRMIADKPAAAVKPDTKSHLKTTNGGSSQPAAGLSAEEIALCKEMMPGLTTKEINDWYAKQK